jgi:hypothetical protein
MYMSVVNLNNNAAAFAAYPQPSVVVPPKKSGNSGDAKIVEKILDALQQILQLLESSQKPVSPAGQNGNPATPAPAGANPGSPDIASALGQVKKTLNKKGGNSEVETLEHVLKDLQEILKLLQNGQNTPAPTTPNAPSTGATDGSTNGASKDGEDKIIDQIQQIIDQILSLVGGKNPINPAGLPISS